MNTTYCPSDMDISDLVDTIREWEIPNYDYTSEIPAIEGTTAFHPDTCTCLACEADAEWAAYEASRGPTCWVCDAHHQGRTCPIDGGY